MFWLGILCVCKLALLFLVEIQRGIKGTLSFELENNLLFFKPLHVLVSHQVVLPCRMVRFHWPYNPFKEILSDALSNLHVCNICPLLVAWCK
jgi:hypothetical protein